MKRRKAVPAVLATSALILATMISSLGADIESQSWIGAKYTGIDAFYGAPYTVYAYETGSNATLRVAIRNNVTEQMNVSAVKVGFDWGANYSSSQCSTESPCTMEWGEWKDFHVSFAVPDTSDASNQFLHGYKIYVEHVNSTTGPKEIVGTLVDSHTENPDFALYSADQADARELSQIISGIPIPSFNSTRARLLVYKAQNETSIGNEKYRRGDFSNAKVHYNTSLTLYNRAYSAEETRGVEVEDLQVKKISAEIDNLEASAGMVSSISTASILLGLATVLFGVGYIIKQLGTLRKPTERLETQ